MTTRLKIGIVGILAVAVVAVLVHKARHQPTPASAASVVAQGVAAAQPMPHLVDLGAHSCIPCKKMAPILDDLRKEVDGRLRVDFIDVWENPDAGRQYGIKLIPTQIFFDASGTERARHEGFMSREDILAQFAAVGVSLAAPQPALVRETPLKPSTHPASQACFMYDGDLNLKTLVETRTAAASRRMCSPNCFFIYLSSLPKPEGIEDATLVTETASGKLVPAKNASYRYQYDAHGHPRVEVLYEPKVPGTLGWDGLKEKEFAVRCAFCDRACYPDDSCRVKADGASLYGCCPVCGLGVAARLQKDIEVEVKDALTGQKLRVITLNGSVESLDPPTLIAWHGQNKNPQGQMVSAGCFKQFFFASPANLKQWLDRHPEATGKMATIGQLLADKMKLSPQQIKNACEIGDCAQ